MEKSFESGVQKTPKHVDRAVDNNLNTPTKISSLFSGTQEKCVACGKTVYPIEKVSVDGSSYHRPCFKCSHGGCSISPSNYVAHEGRLYCRHHHAQLFKEKGDFSQLAKVQPVKAGTEENEDS